MAPAANRATVVIEGFTRLFEEEIYLPDASIMLEEFQWNGSHDSVPHKVRTQALKTSSNGRFSARVTLGHWFRLRLQTGKPPSYPAARDAWLQHVSILNTLLEYESIKSFFELLMEKKISEWVDEGLLNFIGMDSSLMSADKHYLDRNNEISFQVPLRITYKLLETLGSSVYGVEVDKNSCHLAVTALAPKPAAREQFFTEPAYNYSDLCLNRNTLRPAVETLFDCPHGASNVTFHSSPHSTFIHYLGVKDNCKTDLLSTGLTSTTRDGGAILFNMTARKSVGRLNAYQHNLLHIGTHYYLCEPGRIINISPPQGPIGLDDEREWTAKETIPSTSVVSGIFNFVYYLFPEIIYAPATTIDSLLKLALVHHMINYLHRLSE